MATAETVEIEDVDIDNNDDDRNYRITLTREDGKMVTILVPKGTVNGGDDIWNDDAENIGLNLVSEGPVSYTHLTLPTKA